MLADTHLGSVANRIGQFYNVNNSFLAQSLTKIGSGKQYLKPSDNVGYFFRGQSIDRENAQSRFTVQDLVSTRATLDIAGELGDTVHTNLTRMKELITLYWSGSASDEEKVVWKAEFDALKMSVDGMVAHAVYDGRQIMSDSSANPLRTVQLDPTNAANDFKITYEASDVVSAAGLSITGPDKETALAGVQAQMNVAASFIGKTSAYKFGVEAQTSIAIRKMDANNSLLTKIRDVDSGKEMMKMVGYSIRNQASVAMLAQANMLRSGVLGLVVN